MNNRFYKKKYIIAIYDKNDFLIDVVLNPKELIEYKNKACAYSDISRIFNKRSKGYNVYFIDVTEKHNDIFSEEDEIFLQEFAESNKPTDTEIAKKYGINIRTYYRWKKNGTLNLLKGEIDMNNYEPNFLTIFDLSQRLGFSRQYITSLVQKKKIKAIKIGKSWRIPIEEVKRIEKEGL